MSTIVLEAVDKPRGDGDNVLEGAAELDAGNVLDDIDVEVGCVEELGKELAVLLDAIPDRRLGKGLLGDLVRDIGAHENGDVDLQDGGNHIRDQCQAVLRIDALDQADRTRARDKLTLELPADPLDKLQREK